MRQTLTPGEMEERGMFSPRIRAFLAELDRLAKQYRAAKEEFEKSRQIYSVAMEQLIGAKRLGPEVVPPDAWFHWTMRHSGIDFLGIDIGEAILRILRAHAYDVATGSPVSKATDPSLTSWEIAEKLDRVGFTFQTATPRREVHAALIHLKGVIKKKDGRFETEDIEEIRRLAQADEQRLREIEQEESASARRVQKRTTRAISVSDE